MSNRMKKQNDEEEWVSLPSATARVSCFWERRSGNMSFALPGGAKLRWMLCDPGRHYYHKPSGEHFINLPPLGSDGVGVLA